MKRKHYSPEQQQQLVAEWRSSGVSAEEFAARRGFCVGTLWRWRKAWNDAKEPIFRPLILPKPPPPRESSSLSSRGEPVAELAIGGLTARVYAGINPGELSALVAALCGVRAC